MQAKPKNHSIDSIFAFLLLLIFTLFTLMLAGMGSAIYRSGAAHLNENYTSRTAVAYISEKVRQHDQSEAIRISSVGDLPALEFCDTIDGEAFVTYVYFYEGALCELFLQAARTPDPAMGSRIVELASFEIADAAADTTASDTAVTDVAADITAMDTAAAGAAASDTAAMDTAAADTAGPRLLRATAVSEEGNELSVLIHISSG